MRSYQSYGNVPRPISPYKSYSVPRPLSPSNAQMTFGGQNSGIQTIPQSNQVSFRPSMSSNRMGEENYQNYQNWESQRLGQPLM
jgi:hypothetical protein